MCTSGVVVGSARALRSGSVCTPRWKTTSTRGAGGSGSASTCATRLRSTSSANPRRIAKVARRSFSSDSSRDDDDDSDARMVSMARRSTGNVDTRVDDASRHGCSTSTVDLNRVATSVSPPADGAAMLGGGNTDVVVLLAVGLGRRDDGRSTSSSLSPPVPNSSSHSFVAPVYPL